jgi:hypothetical protein
MNMRKIDVVLLALLLAAMAIVPMVSAAENGAGLLQAGPAADVDLTQATTIALANVNLLAGSVSDFTDWKDATVTYANTFYDLNDNKTAYAFEVMTPGKYKGYILVSATTGNYPVLDISKGPIPGSTHASAEKTLSQAQALAGKDAAGISLAKQVYLGGLAYYHAYEIPAAGSSRKNEVYFDVYTGKAADLKNTSAGFDIPVTRAEYTRVQQEKTADIQRSWSQQRKLAAGDKSVIPATQTVSASLPYTATISGVPLYFWRDGCSPTAAGMVLGYWQGHGYSNLPTGNTLIDNLASAMGTMSTWPLNGVTLPTRIDSGITTVAAQYGYYNLRGTSVYAPTFTDDMNEIVANHPFVISMLNGGTGAGRSQPYGPHSVTCLGYMNSVPQLVKIYDTWEGNNYHWLQYGNWGWAMNTYARPI